jgi:Poly(3-hydroxybutyrate) depolymerase
VLRGSGPIDAIYVALHYLNANIGTFANVIRLPELAKARHVLIIVPQAPTTTPSSVVGIEQWPISNEANIDATVQYLDSLVSDVRGAYRLGDVPVVVAGLSNGGDMAYEWGCRSTVPDAIQPVAADINSGQLSDCAPPHPLGSVTVHGTADLVAPYNGLLGAIASVPDVHQSLKTLAGCTAADTVTTLPTIYDSLVVTVGNSSRCPDGTLQDLVTVQNGGHNWPGYAPAQGPVDLNSIGLLGARTNNFDATLQGYDLLIDSIAH